MVLGDPCERVIQPLKEVMTHMLRITTLETQWKSNIICPVSTSSDYLELI